MCIIFIAYKKHPQYKLILAANRDEFYKRPSEPAKFWEDNPKILGGRDIEKMGTWLGINVNGRFGAVTNYRDLSLIKDDSQSRGELVKDFIWNNEGNVDYLSKIQSNSLMYNPFNLILGDTESLYYYSNIEDKILRLKSGVYGLSNHLLDTSWPKLVLGKNKLKKILNGDKELIIEGLFDILSDQSIPDDSELPDTGMGLEWERMLSPIFIESKNYGTRASTVLLIDDYNHVTFIERSLVDAKNKQWKKGKFEFDINSERI